MYIRNESLTNQQFKAGNTKFMLRPGDTVAMTDEEFGDHTTQVLLRKGTIVAVDDEAGLDAVVAQEEEKQAKAAERKLEVNIAGEDTIKQVIMVQCAATKKDGERCTANVSVKTSDYDENTPYFCGHHRIEDASSYEKVEGTWKKKIAETLDDPIPAEEVAELVAEVEAEETLD